MADEERSLRTRREASDPRPFTPTWWALAVGASVLIGPAGALRAYGTDDPSFALIAGLGAAAVLGINVAVGLIWTLARRRRR